ncbi:chloramphenicol acetyltransferase [Chitinophaga flava]|uniref:Chloramphenicol acetyltransferase n=1 Tax=Chitinophaga flava TaxID=2259036 RepID=A0A365XS59_9BACT|nr:chloramphenicol acetyltransferase [Chitinophaga flava]RBL88958.1 chloramphenicol acetyltransferase [Chitinophaga flava]
MKQLLDINTWKRKDHFHFFNQFEEPFFGVCVNVDCTKAYATAREKGYSFFLYYLHKAMVAMNAIEPFRYRIVGEQVWIYDKIDPSPTINRPDGTFGFAYFEYHADFETFEAIARIITEQVQNSTGLVPAVSGENVVHCSSLPWINFTSLSHARSFSFKDSCPKVSFGKMTTADGISTMPVSLHVHHALMDGYHAGQFFEYFQQQLDS